MKQEYLENIQIDKKRSSKYTHLYGPIVTDASIYRLVLSTTSLRQLLSSLPLPEFHNHFNFKKPLNFIRTAFFILSRKYIILATKYFNE